MIIIQTVIAQVPDWVSNRPISSTDYIGISSASKNTSSYQKIAKRNALDDLLSEIRVTIQSVSILNQIDKNGTFKEEFESTIKSSVADEIENLEFNPMVLIAKPKSWNGTCFFKCVIG